jgi:hypothetical protein
VILGADNEFCVVADACVLMPMPLCDTLLRCAEEPSFLRIIWSEEILDEVRRGLVGENFGYSPTQASRRIEAMCAAFLDALAAVPVGLIDELQGIPDQCDRHVGALAIQSHADTIAPTNYGTFPLKSLPGTTWLFSRQTTSWFISITWAPM